MKSQLLIIALLSSCHICMGQPTDQDLDRYDWLGDRYSPEVLEWVDRQNDKSLKQLDSVKIVGSLEEWEDTFLKNYEWTYFKRVPMEVDQVGLYAEITRGGIWSRMPFEKYLKEKKPDFQLELESLGLEPETSWEYDHIVSYPSNYNKCLVLYKKRGHRELKGVIEYDFENKQVVEGGFQLPPAKTMIAWRNDQSVYISTNLKNPYDEGTMIRIWNRGEPLENAEVIFESNRPKVRVKLIDRKGELFVLEERQAFDVSWYHLENDKLNTLNLPLDVKDLDIVSGQLVVHLKSAWKPNELSFESGSIIAIDFKSFLQGGKDFQLIAKSANDLVLDKIWTTKDVLIVRGLQDVQSHLFEWTYKGNLWKSKELKSPSGWNVSVTTTQNESNRYYIRQMNFFSIRYFLRDKDGKIEEYAQYSNESINPDDYEIDQRFATSPDGTEVPYFIVYRKGIKMDGSNPVIMTGYGGWGHSILPSPLRAKWRWVDDGGVFVLANIRGGGEYGPEWHYAARKGKRQNAYDDFLAIAQDLIGDGVTQERKIGIYGASNGGLLVANSFIQNPSIFGAVSIHSGSLKLDDNNSKVQPGGTIGATGERGDPDNPEDWAYMKKISPFHVLEKDKSYPPVLLFSSRNDDVSHPSRSRKFYHRMNDLGYDNVLLIETEGGGHGRTDLPREDMLELAFFYKNIHPDYDRFISRELKKLSR